ncbi:adhesion G protein-coupled receptor L2-like [Dendronephthya gigantea]|uniref:adhesion G protein-coupled receptor L2-like n=1 Tax=Dendronephthya gigantea TaxID=151771 RepID=UPI00106A5BB5|nr:adhesion G protein-coupled receptor L2-like [Dendronephthya gigantea]
MKLPQSLAGFLVIIGAFNIAFCIPIEEQPHVLKRTRRDSIEDYYWNEHLPLGFFIKGADTGNAGAQQPQPPAALFGSGFGNSGSTQPFARSGIPGKPKGSELKTTITCEGEKEWLECDKYKLINIKSAFWGREDSDTCTNNAVSRGLKTDAMCPQDESNTMTKVRNQCQDENACEISASTIFFDKTDCPSTYKYLKLDYECKHSESKIKE